MLKPTAAQRQFLPKGYCHYFLLNGSCKKGQACRFMHQKLDWINKTQPPTHNYIKQQQPMETIEEILECPNFHAKGFCNRFRDCRYFHDGVECEKWIEEGQCENEECFLYHRSLWHRNRKAKITKNLTLLLRQNPGGINLDQIPIAYERQFGEFLNISSNELTGILQQINGVGMNKVSHRRSSRDRGRRKRSRSRERR